MDKQKVSKETENKPKLYTVLATDVVLKWQKLKCFFGFHKLNAFKHCDKYLVAANCKSCSVVKVGNPNYYDGTFYQKTLKKGKALNFIENEIKYVQSVIDRRSGYKDWDVDEISKMIIKDEVEILINYETIPNLNIIKNHIEGTM